MTVLPKTVFVTFPRSGHHWLVDSLLDYFGPISYCEYYHHCKQFPCRDGCALMKNHDFGLGLEIPKDYKIIVQIRNPIDALNSWYRFGEYKKYDFDEFFRIQLGYYHQFCLKWLNKHFQLSYEKHLQDRVGTLVSTIEYLVGNCDIEKTRQVAGKHEYLYERTSS